MDRYTLEDIELIRSKSGISYQEAVALLDYHNGNVARALIDLEKNGRLRKNQNENNRSAEGTFQIRTDNGIGGKIVDLFRKLYYFRFLVSKDNNTIANFSLLFCIASVIFAPRLCILGIVVSLLLGYRFSFNKKDELFMSENIKKIVRDAAQNAKASVVNAVQSMSGEKKENSIDRDERIRNSVSTEESTVNFNGCDNGGFNVNHSTDHAVPVIQTPVQVESKEGSITIDSDSDGYHTATIG